MDLLQSSIVEYNFTGINITDTVYFSDQDILLQNLGPKRREWYVVVILLTVYGVIFVTGVVGNIFTCIVISRTSYMRTSTNYYLFSLAISDVLLLIIGTFVSFNVMVPVKFVYIPNLTYILT